MIRNELETILFVIVYETSFYLAIIFNSQVQIVASQRHFADLLESLARTSASSESLSVSLRRRATTFSVVSTLHCMIESYPSQMAYYRHVETLNKLPRSFNELTHLESDAWIQALRSALHTRNFVESQRLTNDSAVKAIAKLLGPEEQKEGENVKMLEEALMELVQVLLSKLRESSWQTLRVAYRELFTAKGSASSDWLINSLYFNTDGKESYKMLDGWIQQKVGEGQLVVKQGSSDRWIFCRSLK